MVQGDVLHSATISQVAFLSMRPGDLGSRVKEGEPGREQTREAGPMEWASGMLSSRVC